ncbi:MAG: hypothetical protein HKM04_10440 [Legionellales bacterium]|nr:hypothetical protein [Legionellales bacterium]
MKMSVLTMAAFAHEQYGNEIFEILLQLYNKQTLENEFIYQYFFMDKNNLGLSEDALALLEERIPKKLKEILQQRLNEIDQNLTPFKPPLSWVKLSFETRKPKLFEKISTPGDSFTRNCYYQYFKKDAMKGYLLDLAGYTRWLDFHKADPRYVQNWTNSLNRPAKNELPGKGNRHYAKLKILFDSATDLSECLGYFSQSTSFPRHGKQVQSLLLSFAFQNKDKITEIDFAWLYSLRQKALDQHKYLFAVDFFIYCLEYIEHIEEWIKNKRELYHLNQNDDFTDTEKATIAKLIAPQLKFLYSFLNDLLTIQEKKVKDTMEQAAAKLIDKLLSYELISLLDYRSGQKDIVELLAFAGVSERAEKHAVVLGYYADTILEVLKNHFHLSDLINIAKNEVQIYDNRFPLDFAEMQMNSRLKKVIPKIKKMLKEQELMAQLKIDLDDNAPAIYLDSNSEVAIKALEYDIKQVENKLNAKNFSLFQQNLDELLNLLDLPLFHFSDSLNENQLKMRQTIQENILDIVKKSIKVLASDFYQLDNDKARHDIVKKLYQILEGLENNSQDNSFIGEIIAQELEVAKLSSTLVALNAHGQKICVPEKEEAFDKKKVKIGALYEQIKPTEVVYAQNFESAVSFQNEL